MVLYPVKINFSCPFSGIKNNCTKMEKLETEDLIRNFYDVN